MRDPFKEQEMSEKNREGVLIFSNLLEKNVDDNKKGS